MFKHPLGTIALLNNTNYASWKADCEQVLHGIKAWRIVTEEEEEPENPDRMTKAAIYGRKVHEDFMTRRAQAGAIIYGLCSPDMKTHLNQPTASSPQLTCQCLLLTAPQCHQPSHWHSQSCPRHGLEKPHLYNPPRDVQGQHQDAAVSSGCHNPSDHEQLEGM